MLELARSTRVFNLKNSDTTSMTNLYSTSTPILKLIGNYSIQAANLNTKSTTILNNMNLNSVSTIIPINHFNATSSSVVNLINKHKTKITNLNIKSIKQLVGIIACLLLL